MSRGPKKDGDIEGGTPVQRLGIYTSKGPRTRDQEKKEEHDKVRMGCRGSVSGPQTRLVKVQVSSPETGLEDRP